MHWIIGDIHGMYPPLVTVLEEIHHRDSDPQLIFCGDYVNRGPQSARVVDLLLTLNNARFCRGNHDDTLDLLLSGSCFVTHAQVGGIVATFDHFMKYGLDATLLSYGIDPRQLLAVQREPSPEGISRLVETIPETHREFFHSLPVFHAEKDFFVAHAKWDVEEPCGVPSFATQIARSMKLRHDILWGRFTLEEVARVKRWDRHGFFGHTPVTLYHRATPLLPVHGDKITLLDTAAAVHLEGRLTAWCVEEKTYVQADRDGDLAP
ncbi:MAG: metallophosphoesterase [Tepidisphaeraceae bacterium]